MRLRYRRALSVVAALAVAATTAPFVNPPSASAAGTLAGAATVSPTSGTSASSFQLSLPAGAACPGDSPNDGYRWQTYMVPASVDPSTLTFDANGPTPAGTGASFRQPLYDTGFSPIVDRQTAAATTAGGPGPIINIPAASYSVFAPGDIPPGSYNIGIACTLGPESPTQMKSFWNLQKTFTTNASGGPAQVNWSQGAAPAAPALSSLAAGDGQLIASYSSTPSDPATTSFTATAVPQGGGTTVTATSTSTSSTTITGLLNGTTYDVAVKATNAVGDSAASNTLSATPNVTRQPVQNLTASPATGQVGLDWDPPSDVATYPVTGYSVTHAPADGTVSVSGTSATVSGLTAGSVYAFTVTPTYASGPVGQASTIQATPLAAQVVLQEVSVVRPVGALVFTQVCGVNGALPAEAASKGFPTGLAAVAATGTVDPNTGRSEGGSAPTTDAGTPDPKFAGYPYPEKADGSGEADATYPTHCGVNLGAAKLVTRGEGAGQFFAASGVLSQVSVVDTRDTDEGWTANGTMGAFSAGPGKTFSGSQLGWNPVKTADTASFVDSDGTSYDQVVSPGSPVAPNTANASGLSSGSALGTAEAGSGLGIGVLDARLKVLIPVTKKTGVYTGVLTISAL